jgi:hypothetical protein
MRQLQNSAPQYLCRRRRIKPSTSYEYGASLKIIRASRREDDVPVASLFPSDCFDTANGKVIAENSGPVKWR